jgi:hypothetical protein
VRGALTVVVAADEEPGLSASGHGASQRALGPVVVEQKAAVGEDAQERVLLPDGVSEGGAKQPALVANFVVLESGLSEERVGMRSQVDSAQPMDLGGGPASPGGLALEDSADSGRALRVARKGSGVTKL